MKKLVIAALAIASLAACTKSNVQYEQPGEISLQPVAQKATKAVTGTTYPEDEMFNVWAWWVQSTAGSEDRSQQARDYIVEGTFKKKDNSWGGWDMAGEKVNPYYWPTTGSLFFAGYSPADVPTSVQFAYNLKDATMTITGYQQSNNIMETKDLMWFDVVDKSYDKTTANTNGVPVTFKHALSWLTFKFNLKDQQTAHNWKVTNVKLTGIETMANCTIEKGNDPVWKDWTILNQSTLSDEEKAKAKTILIYNNEGKEITYVPPYTWTNGTTAVADFGGTQLELGGSNGVLIIPQSCAADEAQLEISYLLKVPANDEYISQSKTLFLNAGTEDGTTWKPGKHYVYTITFGADEILINPTVADWTTTPVNVQVQ